MLFGLFARKTPVFYIYEDDKLIDAFDNEVECLKAVEFYASRVTDSVFLAAKDKVVIAYYVKGKLVKVY